MKFHLDIPYGYRVRMRTKKKKKSNQKAVIQKLRKVEQPFLYASYCFVLVHIAMKFYKNVPYLVMARTRIVYTGQIDGQTARQSHSITHPFFSKRHIKTGQGEFVCVEVSGPVNPMGSC